jgi:hypothetical protein
MMEKYCQEYNYDGDPYPRASSSLRVEYNNKYVFNVAGHERLSSTRPLVNTVAHLCVMVEKINKYREKKNNSSRPTSDKIHNMY